MGETKADGGEKVLMKEKKQTEVEDEKMQKKSQRRNRDK